jgi:hypothetical protein
MFLVDPKVFRFVVKGVKAIFLGGSKRVEVHGARKERIRIIIIIRRNGAKTISPPNFVWET